MTAPQYVIGIDLGTTNTVVSYAALEGDISVRPFAPLQMVGDGEQADRRQLPSFAFVASQSSGITSTLDWETDGLIVGEWARALGATHPEQTIHSAKSWLSYSGVDRTSPILPWGGTDDRQLKRSPVDVSAALMSHIRSAWDATHAVPMHEQDVVLTVPASFDDTARRLTVAAAKKAGLGDRLFLLEEPQAAFYAQLDAYAAVIEDSGLVLVVDVGGGTTDLTLIKAKQAQKGALTFERIAVGEHLLLGGDNMDLLLAYEAERRIVGRNGSLNSRMMSQLVSACRTVKEAALSHGAADEYRVTLPGRGRRLIQGVRSCLFQRDELIELMTNAFVPIVDHDATLNERRGMALSALGLPYEHDPVLTKHIATFLARNRTHGFPSHVLFNGGFFRADMLREAVFENLCKWGQQGGSPPEALHDADLDAAVSVGATVFGLARHGLATRIGGGCAVNYFVTVERRNRKGKRKGRVGICLLPKGTPSSKSVRIDSQVFNLISGRPVQMTVTAGGDAPEGLGETVSLDTGQYRRLSAVQTVVDAHEDAGQVPVTLSASMSEQGLLEMHAHAVDRAEVYEFEFQEVSGEPQFSEPSASQNEGLRGDFDEIEQLVLRVFGKPDATADPREIRYLTRRLEELMGMPRTAWRLVELRRIADYLLRGVRRRRRSEKHESTFYHLLGFCLRPGIGDSFDEWRISQMWSLFSEGVHFHQRLENWDAWWIYWRRLSGGLNATQHSVIYDRISPWLQRVIDESLTKKDKLKQPTEAFRLLASLEHIPKTQKVIWGDRFLEMSNLPQHAPFALWCLARTGARELVYGGAEEVVQASVSERWLEALLQQDWHDRPFMERCVVSLARCTGDRQRDLPYSFRERISLRLKEEGMQSDFTKSVEEPTEILEEEAQKILGDSLPDGLRMII